SEQDSAVVKKKGILNWLFRSKREQKEKQVASSQSEIDNIALKDVSKEVQAVKRQEESIESAIKKQELALLANDKVVTRRIKALLDSYEKAELEHLADQAEQTRSDIQSTNRQILIFCVAMVLLILLMTYVIIRYIKQSRLYNEALERSKIDAENLAVAKERFLTNMSHEIRTPINAISGFTDQLAKGKLDDDQQRMIQIVQKSTDHLVSLVNDVLDLSKLHAGKIRLEEIPFDLKKALSEVYETLQSTASSKDLDFRIEDDALEYIYLLGDPFRLKQILLNLVSNAIKFTDSGTVMIKAYSGKTKDESTVVHFEINDSGIGMDEMQVEKVFEEFEQAENSTTRRYGGTGLGLSISKMLIEAQNGEITIKSKLGAGTTVFLSIPYRIVRSDLNGQVQRMSSDKSFYYDLNILVADDEEYNRELLGTILKNKNCSYTMVENGLEVINAISTGKYDVVLLDIRMPEMDGVEATRKIRSFTEKALASIPIIALSASTTDSDKARYQEAGIDAVLAKPFKENKIVEIINQTILEKKSNGPAVIEKRDPGKDDDQIDFSELRNICGGKNESYSEMLTIFIDSTNEGVAALKEKVTQNEIEAIIECAHKMSAPCKHLNAVHLHHALKELVSTCNQEPVRMEDISTKINDIEFVSKHIISMVEAELKSIQNNR
ncbi:MAG: response regulator, partial [Bacteroidia bacterium]|nr:response regulator [Bacteroidia bacterium]